LRTFLFLVTRGLRRLRSFDGAENFVYFFRRRPKLFNGGFLVLCRHRSNDLQQHRDEGRYEHFLRQRALAQRCRNDEISGCACQKVEIGSAWNEGGSFSKGGILPEFAALAGLSHSISLAQWSISEVYP